MYVGVKGRFMQAGGTEECKDLILQVPMDEREGLAPLTQP